MDKCKTGLRYNVVPPPYTGNFMPPKPDLVYPSLDDFVDVNESASKSIVEKPTVETNEPKTARKEDGAPIIEDWVSESEKEDVPKIKTDKEAFLVLVKRKQGNSIRPQHVGSETKAQSFRPSLPETIGNSMSFSKDLTIMMDRYREYDLAYLKLIFEFCIHWVWKSVRYGVSKELDTAYWGFLGVGTTLDIFQNIIFIPYLKYGVLSLSGYGVLSFILSGLW
ncbi:hypothetical protein Tco_0570841 [Tanacetum coccineum]